MIGLFGGTFDPIHYGHLNAAWQVYQTLALQELRFMPCHTPPHRATPQVDAVHRLAMLKLAISDVPGFVIDDRELKTQELSYTVNSLAAIRKEVGDTPICLLLGRDAFSQIASWHQPERLIQLAHLVILERPNETLLRDAFIDELLQHQVHEVSRLKQQTAGLVYFANNTELAISASLIRQQLAQHISPRFLLPEAVLTYITAQRLYYPTL